MSNHLQKPQRNRNLCQFNLIMTSTVFSRVSTSYTSNTSPKEDVAELNLCKKWISEHSPDKAKLLHYYAVLLARILCPKPAFQQYGILVPKHIPHEFSKKMSRSTSYHVQKWIQTWRLYGDYGLLWRTTMQPLQSCIWYALFLARLYIYWTKKV